MYVPSFIIEHIGKMKSIRTFAIVKSTAIQAMLMALIFMMPMVFTAIVPLGDSCEKYALFENSSEEGQADEKESEAKEERDLVETYLFQMCAFSNNENSKSGYFSNSKALLSTSKDVLTPPPEFL